MLLKLFISQGKAGSWGFPLNCMALCLEWGLWRECIIAFPTNFDVSIFSCQICENHSTSSWISLRGIAPSVVVYLVCA